MGKIKTGIVGLGRLGLHHAMDIKNNIPEAELVAACSIVQKELDNIKDWGIALYNDFDEMLKHEGLEAVVIVSTTAMHKEHIFKAMNAGKHVFCEKPMALTVEDCLEIEKFVESKKPLVFQLGFMRRYDKSFAEAKRIIKSGEIGDPIMVKATNLDAISMIDGFVKFAPTSGGEFLDMAIHDIDMSLWFLEDDVDTIYATGNSYVVPEVMQYGECDNAFGIFRFKKGAMAFIHAGRTAPFHQVEAEIIGTKETLRISAVPRKDRIQVYSTIGVTEKCIGSFQERFTEAYHLEKLDFYECVLTGKTPVCGAKDGTAATRIAFAANDAYQSGKIVKVEY